MVFGGLRQITEKLVDPNTINSGIKNIVEHFDVWGESCWKFTKNAKEKTETFLLLEQKYAVEFGSW